MCEFGCMNTIRETKIGGTSYSSSLSRIGEDRVNPRSQLKPQLKLQTSFRPVSDQFQTPRRDMFGMQDKENVPYILTHTYNMLQN